MSSLVTDGIAVRDATIPGNAEYILLPQPPLPN